MKKISAEMLITKAKEIGKELTIQQAEEMITKAASLNDDELSAISGGNAIDDLVDIYNDAADRNTDCKYAWDNEKKCWHKDHIWKKTGATRPGRFFGDEWPDVEVRCKKCGKTCWALFSSAFNQLLKNIGADLSINVFKTRHL